MGLDSIMRFPTETRCDEDRMHQEIFHGHYLFEDAYSCYRSGDQRVPPRISHLEVMPDEHVAILGRNGAGKSTLLQTMTGSVEIIQDDVQLGNLSLAQIDTADLRHNIDFLSQNARLFFGTLRENLTLGASCASDAWISEILKVSGTAAFVKQFAKGLAYPIMKGGSGSSSGQRQSILLARTLLRSPNIVLLDEPSTSLDKHIEQEFIQRLNQWLGNRTLIVTTHRMPVLELVKHVAVLREGQLVMDAPKT